MANKNAPEMEPAGSGKKNESKKLVVLILLLVIMVAGYLYLFTGIFKPQEEAAAPQPEAVTQVKQPLPPKPDEQAGGEQPAKKEAVKAEEAKEEKPAPQPQPQAVAKAAPETAAKAEPPKKEAQPAAKEQAKPAPAAKVAKAEPVKKPEKPAEKKEPAPAAAAKGKEAVKAKPAAPAKEKGTGDTAGAAKAEAEKAKAAAAPEKGTPRKAEAKKEKPVRKAAVQTAKGGRFTLLIGEFVPDKKFAHLQARLQKQYKPLEKKTIQKVEPMNRLFVGEFPDYDTAAAELDKLRQLTRDAFSIEKNGKYYVYAGSYFGGELAASEKKRLSAKGVKIELQKVEVPVSIVRLTAGRFASKDEANRALAALAKQGVRSTVTEAAAP